MFTLFIESGCGLFICSHFCSSLHKQSVGELQSNCTLKARRRCQDMEDSSSSQTQHNTWRRIAGAIRQYSAFSPFTGIEVGTPGVPAYVMSSTVGSSPDSPRCTSSTDSPTACP